MQDNEKVLLNCISKTSKPLLPADISYTTLWLFKRCFMSLEQKVGGRNKRMVTTIYMSKEYDMIEWEFIKSVIENGFLSNLDWMDYAGYFSC